MSGLNYFDIFALVLVLVSGAFAYSRGLAREVMSILGWVVSALFAYLAAPLFAPLMNSIPYLGNIIQHSCELGILGAFAVTFALALIASTVITSVVLTITKLPGINIFNRTLGLLFGVLRGGFILTIILLVVDTALPTGGMFDAITQSNSAEIFQYSKNLMKESIPSETPDWVTYVYQNLMASCNVIEMAVDSTSELPTDDLTSDELPQE